MPPMKIIYLVDYQVFDEDLNGAAKIMYHTIKEIAFTEEVDVVVIKNYDTPVPSTFFEVRNIFVEQDMEAPTRPTPFLVKPFPKYSKAQVAYLARKYNFAQYDIIHTSITLRLIGKIHPAVVYGS